MLSSIFEKTDTVVIIAEWDIYRTINWYKVSKLMRNPAWIFDKRSIIKVIDIKNSGLNFWKIGNSLG